MAPVVAFAAVYAVAAPASAASNTFAQFSQQTPAAKIFTYTNLAGGPPHATLTANGGTVLISDIGLLVGSSLASIVVSATSDVVPVLDGSTITQIFSGSIVFTLLAPQLGLNNSLSTHALTVNFTGAKLFATSGSKAPTFAADVDQGATISYSSDFADLFNMTERNFSLSFSSATKGVALTAGRLPTFQMSGAGTFAGGIPEPLSWGLMTIGFGAVGGALRAGRRRPAGALGA